MYGYYRRCWERGQDNHSMAAFMGVSVRTIIYHASFVRKVDHLILMEQPLPPPVRKPGGRYGHKSYSLRGMLEAHMCERREDCECPHRKGLTEKLLTRK